MAVAHVPNAPAPYTIALPPGGGGCRVTECSETANGSAITATSSGIESGTGMSMESWAGRYSAKPPVASRERPVCIPGASRPWMKLKQRL